MRPRVTFSREFNVRRFIRLCLALSLVMGMLWLLFGWQIPLPLRVVDYAPNTFVYGDRDYVSSVDSPLLRETRVVLLSRHSRTPIWIVTDRPATVYRMLASENDNSVFDDHHSSSVPVFVEGLSCNMEALVFKEYPPGTHALPSGGPVAASPILVRCDGQIRAERRMTGLRWLLYWLTDRR